MKRLSTRRISYKTFKNILQDQERYSMDDTPIEVALEIDPKAITYGEYKKLLKSQEKDSDVTQAEAWDIAEKIVINKEALDDLPMVDVVPAILQALENVFGSLKSPKAKN